MKELTIEQKAQRYDEAIEKLRDFYRDYDTVSRLIDVKEELANLFPELKESDESEDERIRKNCIHFLELQKQHHAATFEIEECIDWLEKKGEQSKEATYTHEVVTGNGNIKALVTEKVQLPKFEIGDLITNGILVGRVDAIHKLGYHAYFGYHYADVPDVENWHKWTIKDAKGGSVLSYNDGHGNDSIELIKSITDKKIEFWFCLTNGNRYEVFDGITPYTNLVSREDATPATKEQCDTLMKAMADAGYTFDFEKKELKKIESYNLRSIIKDKPSPTIKKVVDSLTAWSEEDSEHLDSIIESYKDLMADYKASHDVDYIPYDSNTVVRTVTDDVNFLESLKDKVQPQLKQELSEEDEAKIVKLKSFIAQCKGFNKENRNKAFDMIDSIKPKYTWKPTEEQMDAVKSAALDVAKFSSRSEQLRLENEPYYKALMSLYNDLEKLRDE